MLKHVMPASMQRHGDGYAFQNFAWVAWQAATERAAKTVDMRARSIEAARAHADGSLSGADPRYFGPLLSTLAEISAAIRGEP